MKSNLRKTSSFKQLREGVFFYSLRNEGSALSSDKFVYVINTSKILKDNNISIAADNKNIIQKDNRPYYVSISLNDDYSAFIPIRTKLPHKYGFITKGTGRQISGLDYTKSLIVETEKIQQYLIRETGISFAEYTRIQENHALISRKYKQFIFDTFIPISEKKKEQRTKTENRVFDFSSLQYFEDTLQNIKNKKNKDRLMDALPRGGRKPVSEKSQALLKKAEDGVKEFLESEKYKHFLKTMSQFHQYSVNNTILIALQKPDAKLVAGFKAWQKKFKRQVTKGEKAIKIIGCRPYDKWIEKEVNGKKERQKIQGFSFFPVSVFDVSQTTGEPLPQLTTELTAEVNGYRDLYHAIKRSTTFKVGFEEITSGAKGYCDMKENRIALNKGMSEAQTIKTLIHEITHADLHSIEFKDQSASKTSLRVKETEAESVAFVVSEHFGIDTSEYSFPYLGSWAKDSTLTELKESFERIQTQADDLIQRIDKNLEQVQKEREQDKERPAKEKNQFVNDQKVSLDDKLKQAEAKASMINEARKKDQLPQNQKKTSKTFTKKEDRET
ncbi:hypothetical protein BHY27_14940 [Listeria monocytogenes]|uniref:DUF6782 family putative metallopeptidase n=1 Tax=Enterococcus casseliflavus TaxID=37734 RepID=UPI0010D6FC30|nr:hypothetical protein [Listeria monocytogenes]EAV9844980.1 hypothetical protein [Listeria monocytogenes]HAB7326453.1 hypothetical protein [Listeria monocytogenes]HAC1048515.1 hypothetical protein [Listeria monocytogenes]HDT8433481.1 hypothetical protein [Listeria monocytogenes]